MMVTMMVGTGGYRNDCSGHQYGRVQLIIRVGVCVEIGMSTPALQKYVGIPRLILVPVVLGRINGRVRARAAVKVRVRGKVLSL